MSERARVYAYVLECGERYWEKGREQLVALPLPAAPAEPSLALARVELPDWARDLGVGTPPALLVDAACLLPGPGPAYERCDWLRAAFHHLTGATERDFERRNGPAFSYLRRLQGIDRRLFERAWVNRIFLLLRRWVGRRARRDEAEILGPLPAARVDLTHDVDAIAKTTGVRLKRAAVQVVNALRLAGQREPARSIQTLVRAGRFVASIADYWRFPEIRALEERYGVRSTFHFYAGPPGWGRGAGRLLLDPPYDVRDPALRRELGTLIDGGWRIGLHPSFDAWSGPRALEAQRLRLEAASGSNVSRCRQHWLRFSWSRTWRAQQEASLTLDSTLGFNDHPGFRNGCALRFRPWDGTERQGMTLEALPLLFMDSHFYDYALLDEPERGAEMARWLDELKAVRGEASVLWHQRVMHPDYGWGPGYEEVLRQLP